MTQTTMVQEQSLQPTFTQAGSLLDTLINQSSLPEEPATRSLVRTGLGRLLRRAAEDRTGKVRVDRAMVDAALAEIDEQLSRQLDAILHHPAFQRLESSWRGLKYLVEKTDFRQNIRISLLDVSKEALRDDFLESPDVTYSSLYHHLYSAEYGQHGGSPFAAIIADYEFGPGALDVSLLQNIGAVSSMAHAPFVAAAGPAFFGVTEHRMLPRVKDLKVNFEQPQFAAWRGLRGTEEARYIGLTLPRFLARQPYGRENPTKEFSYEENVSASHECYLWTNSAYALGTRLTDSFARYGWCPNIIGPRGGGQVEGLPMHTFRSIYGDIATKIPTEVLISEAREMELSEEGFISLVMRKDSNNACFFSASSIQKPKLFGSSPEGKQAETNFKLGAQLPYLLVVSRLAHYIKVIQRENLGTFKDRLDLERELNQWIRQYVSDQDYAQPGVRARKPLRQARVTVEDVQGEPGWYRVDLKVVPHFKYMGALFTLSLVGKLDVK